VATRPTQVPELVLVAERRIADLFPAGGAGRMEASGVLTVDDEFLVVFDDSRNIGRIGRDLSETAGNVIIRPQGFTADRTVWDGYEDIARDPVSGDYFLLVEAAEQDNGDWMAKVERLDSDFAAATSSWLPFRLPDAGKGMEGLSCVLRAGSTHLLAICEGNRCEGGKAGKRPGGGRIQVFGSEPDGWRHSATIELPGYLWFVDYSSVDISGDRIAATSQESSALWVGRLAPDSWRIVDDGAVWEFPRAADGRVVYCLVEGVSWIDDSRFVTVSDRAKSSTPGRCREKQQSVHIFKSPPNEVVRR